MNRGRQFSRGSGGTGMGGAPYPRNRRFRGQYTRTRLPLEQDEQIPYQQNQIHNQIQQQNQHQQHHNQQNHRRSDIEEIKDICLKLGAELDLVKDRVNEIAANLERMQVQTKKTKVSKKHEQTGGDVPNRNQRRDKDNKSLPTMNDDSTTQAADPSSEDKIDGEDGGERLKKVHRRRKQPYGRRGFRRRLDSSDTSPQNGDERRSKPRQRKVYPQLNETEMNEVVQAIEREFLASDLPSVTKAISDKGPAVAKEFAYAILDHAIQDVANLEKLGDIANNLAQVIISDEGGREFQTGLSSALNDLSKRGDEVVIDAPRYMDTLGHLLGRVLIAMHDGRGKKLIKRCLTRSLHSFVPSSRAALLASIMRGIAQARNERLAKTIWEISGVKWTNLLKDGTVLETFLADEKVDFTTKVFSPEPPRAKRPSESVDKFADDVTDLVEKGCSVQTLEDIVRDLGLEPDEKTEYLGTLVYAIVRGCLVTDSGESKLDNETLNKYSAILESLHSDNVALNALTALTKLWHTLNCPQNLMSNILLALHNIGVASCYTLQTWLNSDDLKNIPGIGAARLNSKRCIEDLCAKRT